MSQATQLPILLNKVLPSFCKELETLLQRENKPMLASQVASLMIVDRCRCGDYFCASFYTQQKPDGAYGPGHDSFELDPERGMIILDVLGETIAQVEVLYRDDIREVLQAVLP